MKYAKDFLAVATPQKFSDMAENHLECWKDRYYKMNKKEISFDLNVNHDDSLEIESVETDLGRKLTDSENGYVIDKFHKAVLSFR